MAEHEGHRTADSLEEFFNFFDGSPFPEKVVLVYRPKDDLDEYAPYLFDFLCDCTGWTVFIDEVDNFCNPHFIPREFRNLINFRRHLEIDLILVARRPAAIHRDLSALASEVFMFHTHESNDLNYIKNSVGDTYANKCANLRQFQYLQAEFPPKPEEITE